MNTEPADSTRPRCVSTAFANLAVLCLGIGLLCCAGALADAVPEAISEKLVHSEDILSELQQGSETVKVIVNLAEPWELRRATEWNSRASLRRLQAEIRARQQKVLDKLGPQRLKLRRRFANQAAFSAEVNLDGLNALLNDPCVCSIEPVYKLQLHLAQGIPLMNAETPRLTYNGQGVAIAICDDGVDYTHPMLGGGGFPNSKVIGGYDFGDDDTDPHPDGDAHGTCCAGIAAGDLASVGDYIGGVAPSARVYALKVEDNADNIYSDYVIDAWNWCVTHKNDDPNNPILVISNSFGGGRYFAACDGDLPSVATAIDNVVAAGITLLASAGNEGYCDSTAWPACISNAISVGAVYDAAFGTSYPCVKEDSCADKRYTPSGCSPFSNYYAVDETQPDMVTSYSNTAPFLDVFAPSDDAYTTDAVGLAGYASGDYYAHFGGTSAACPYAAGAVACLQSAAMALTSSYLTPAEVRDKLTSTGDPITDGKVDITKPRVNLERAINAFTGLPPVAYDAAVSVHPAVATTITLQAAELDGGQPDPPGALSYTIESLPSHGTLTDPCAGAIAPNSIPYTLAENGNSVVYKADSNCFLGTDYLTFKVNDGGSEPNGGDSNTALVTINVQNLPVVVYQTDFEGGLPAGWSIVDGDSDGYTWVATEGYSDRYNDNWTGTFMIVDSDLAGNVPMDEELISPTIDCSNLQNVTLRFRHYFRWWVLRKDEKADVDVRIDGGDWQNLIRFEDGDASGLVELALSPFGADGSSDVQVRWHYYNARFEYYWGVDDVEITAAAQLEYPAADFTQDCDVDFGDYSLFSAAWLTEPNDPNWDPGYDISEPNDNLIDALDLAVFSQSWLIGTE